jgi:ABC-type polysaccharide/polyol phosphate export permease
MNVWKYRELLRNLVYKEMKVTYCASFLGLLWAMLIPFARIMVLWMVFSFVFKSQTENFVIYLVTGVLSWNFFSTALMRSTEAISSNSNLLKKIYFPRLILPTSTVVYQLLLFGMGFVVFLPIYFLSMKSFSYSLLLYPLALLLFVGFSLGVCFMLSAVTVFYKDVKQIVEVVIYVLFWITPIVYGPEQMGGKLALLLKLNPLTHYMELFQEIIFRGLFPGMALWSFCAVAAAVSLLLGVFCFRSLEQKFVEEL